MIERHKGGGGDDRSVDSNVAGTWQGLLTAEGCAYAVLVRGRGADGRESIEGSLCLHTLIP